MRLTENNSKYFKKLLDILKFQAISMGEDDTVVHYVNPGFQITHNIYSNPVVGLSGGVFTYSRENLGYNANIDAGVFIYGSQSLYNWVCEQLYPEQHRDVYHEQVSNHQRKIEALCKINPESIYVTYNAEKHEQESIFIGEGFNAEFMLKQTVELVNNFSKFYGIVGNDPIDKINLLAEQNIISLDVKETLTNLVALGIKLAYLAQKHYGYHTHNQNNNVFFKDAPAENRFVIPKQEYKQLKKTLDKVDALKAFVLQFKHDEESAIEAVKDKISNAQNQIQLTSIMDELTAGYRAKDREIENAQKVILDAMTDRSIAMNAISTKVTIAQNHTTLNTLMDELVAIADEMKNEIHKAQNHLALTTLTTSVGDIDKALSQSTSHLKHMIVVRQIPKDRVDEVLNFLFSRPSYTLKESPPVEIVLGLICTNLVSNERIDEVLDFFFTIINNGYNIKNSGVALNGISHLLHMKKDIITHRIDEILNLLIKSYDNNENDANNKDYLLKIMTELVSSNQVSCELWDEAWNRLYSNAQKNDKDYDFVYTIERLFEKGESLRGLKKELSEEQKLGVIDLFISKSQNSATDEINYRQFDKYFQILLH